MKPQPWLLRAQGLSKKFSRSLAQSMRYGIVDSLRRLIGLPAASDRLRPGEFWAVDQVSFDLEPGHCLGVMGVNGSGKTTLLRILNGVYVPDAGTAHIRGKVGALIAAGAGFSPVLTGRENIYVNGALLGMSRREVTERLDEILAFAEIGEFIDAPVKHYSSGMQVRLGFAVAAVSQPDVLLVDEVLAVGDLNFQKKCYEYLHRLKERGTAIVLVSHSVGAIWALCDQGLYLHKGRVEAHGPVEQVVRMYGEHTSRASLGALRAALAAEDEPVLANTYGGATGGTGELVINRTRTLSAASGEPQSEFSFGEAIVFESTLEVRVPFPQPIFRYTIDAIHYKYVACLDSIEQGMQVKEMAPGSYVLRTKVPEQNLMPGTYTVNVAVCQRGFGSHVFFRFNAGHFQIRPPRDRFLYADDNAVLFLPAGFCLERTAAQEAA